MTTNQQLVNPSVTHYKLTFIITIMREIHEDQDNHIKEEFAKFINLLQSDSHNNNLGGQEDNSQMLSRTLTKKLSIILSASEPQSSRGDKQNSNPSANLSFDSGVNLSQSQLSLFDSLAKTNISLSQAKLLQKLKDAFKQLKCENNQHQIRIQELQRNLQVQKQTNGRMINVLLKMDKKEKQRESNLAILLAKYHKVKEEIKLVQGELKIARENLGAVQNDNQFMRGLIMHANENYEGLQRMYRDLEDRMEKSDVTTRKSIKKSSADNLLKSAVTKKKSHSPARSEIQHSPTREDSQQVYRKMILRTLKMRPRNVGGR